MDSSHDEATTAVQQKDGEEDADPANANNSAIVPEISSAVEDDVSLGSPVSETVNSSVTSEAESNKSAICTPEVSEDPSQGKSNSHSEKPSEKGVVIINVSADDPGQMSTVGAEDTAKLSETEGKTSQAEDTAKLSETEGKTSQDEEMTPIVEGVENEPVEGTSSKSTESQNKSVEGVSSKSTESIDTQNVEKSIDTQSVEKSIDSQNVEKSIDSQNEEEGVSGPSLVADSLRQPYSPYSDKEVDLSEERVLMIDESEASHSESAANVSHTSSGILDSDNIDEAASTANDINEKADSAVKESTKGATPIVIHAPLVSSISSIEESIERCIANYSCESSEEVSDRQSGTHSPVILPKKKRPAARTKGVETDRFPYNYGFKIITNKIDLSASPRKAFSTISKLQDGSPSLPANISMKRIKLQGKSLLEHIPQAVASAESKEQENTETLSLSSKSLSNIKINFSKKTEEPSEKVTPKERPTIGLKVRDVESINAAIRTVKAPPTQVLQEETNNILNSSAIDKGLPDDEITSQASDKSMESGPEGSSVLCKSSLRYIAPKCDPIASNDQQAIKMIRDLIQLPSIPVYVPNVTDSKHFNGRLHLCHGCGDRFVLLKSLLEHQNRRSCVIKFQCLRCDSAVLCFFNRCEFIRHLYNHNQTLTTVMLQYHIAVERLPPQNSGIFDVTICQECKIILKVPLFDHMNNPETSPKKSLNLALKCQWCSLLLPTKCAYQAHRRMHFLQGPHVCPECGDMSADLPSFNVHINSVCFHTSKRSLFQCTQCKAEMYDARKLERHVRERHIRDVFKCNFCFVACFNLKDLEKHRRHNHQEKLAEEPPDDDPTGVKYAFHLCDMCPNRLIRRIRLGQHVLNHTYSHAEITYVYECRKCKVTFSSKELLSAHVGFCYTGTSVSSAQALTSVVANGTDVLVQPPQTVTSNTRDPVVFETQPPVTDSRSSEVHSDFSETVIPQQTSFPEEEDDDMIVITGDLPPPLQKAPVIPKIAQPVTNTFVRPVIQQIVRPRTQPANSPVVPAVTSPVTQPSNSAAPAPEKKKKKKKKKATKKSPVKTDVTYDAPKEEDGLNSFEQDLFMDGDSIGAGEDAMEVVLNCLECGTNLTSELGSYCTLCEQKREAGDSYKTASPNPLLTAPPKPLLNVAKKKPSKKLTGGNYSCRICNALISKTCDKAAIKRHFISKHKEIFIAALQTGINAKRNGETLTREQLFSKMGKPNAPSQDRSESTSKDGLAAKKSPVASLTKLSPKKKKKKPRKPVSESDTDDDSYVASSPSREGKKPKEKRKKSYSPAFPVLEQGMVAPDEKSSETNENMRTCYKCSFRSVDKEEFMAHVATHKTNPKDLQCPACGMCFVVRPSLEKHLLILHGMQNVEQYLSEHGLPPVAKIPEDEDVDMLDRNQCKVCHMKFDSEALLEKHFRTHGSAFLLSKQFRRSS